MAVKRPPGPKNPPVLGHFAVFRRNPLAFLEDVAAKFGDICWFRLGNQEMHFLNHPDLVQELLVTQQNSFQKSRILQRARMLLGDGLLTSEGDFHLRQRRLVQPAFHRDRLMRYAADMAAISERVVERWKPGVTLDVHEEMTRLTLAIVARTLFSADVDAEAKAIGQSMTDVLGLFGIAMLPFSELLVKLPIPASVRFRRARAQLDKTIYQIIEERRRSGGDSGDLLSMLILAQDEEADGGRMTDQQVRDEALTLFLAGHETTANALTWAWYLLSQNKEAAELLKDEVDEVLCGRRVTFDDVPRLGYTRAVFAETMRLYPPAYAIGRMAVRDVRLGGFDVPARSIVLASPYVMHRDERYWKNPEQFQPERFLEPEGKRPKFAYFPFGGGSRVCIGERFAWMEGVIALATVAQRFVLELAEDQVVQTQAQITLRPRYGMRMKLTRR